MRSTLDIFRRDGLAVLPRALAPATVDEIQELCDPLLVNGTTRRPGVRRVLGREPRLTEVLLRGEVGALMHDLCGAEGMIVRAILFDKTPETNWLVPWHQDATIAVAERIELPGFGPWAVKDGEYHCQPTIEVMESIVTLRIHVDANTAANGPLRVIRGSHRLGLLNAADLQAVVARGDIVEALVPRGGVVMTTPLAVHSSLKSTDTTARRRVLHLDISTFELPGGLRWAEALCPATN